MINDDDLTTLSLFIGQLEALATGTVTTQGRGGLFEKTAPKKATIVDAKRTISLMLPALKRLYAKLGEQPDDEQAKRIAELEGALREYVDNSSEHDVGGGDVVIATCESRERAIRALQPEASEQAAEKKAITLDWPACNPGCFDCGRHWTCTCDDASESIARQRADAEQSNYQEAAREQPAEQEKAQPLAAVQQALNVLADSVIERDKWVAASNHLHACAQILRGAQEAEKPQSIYGETWEQRDGREAALEQPLAHHLYEDEDENKPSAILDRNGQVVLGLCKRCGKAEAELEEPCIPRDALNAMLNKRGYGCGEGSDYQVEQHNDRELLELAAKAAGIYDDWPKPDYDVQVDDRGVFCSGMGKAMLWNPLTDDGDRYRLARTLGISIDFTDCCAWKRFPNGDIIQEFWDNDCGDEAHAIVRAAAEIGKAML